MAKKNAKGGGTIRQRPDGRWEARYTVGRDPGTGKQIQRSVYGSTQKEARQKLAQAVAAIDSGTYKEPCKMTVGEWLDIWQQDYLSSVKPRTADSYRTTVETHLKPAFGAVKLEALNPHTIQSLYNALSRERDGKPGLSPKSVRNVHGVLHKALQQAVTFGYIKTNPSGACTLPRAERKEIHPLDEEQISTFLKVAEGHNYELLYRVALFTGMREGELLGLTWDCVDFEKGVITVSKQLQKERRGNGAYHLVSPKNGKVRRITPAPSVMDMLKTQRKRQVEWRIKAGQLWEDTDLVFTNEIGHNLSAQTVYLHFKKLAERAGFPDARLHDLRHSYAVASLKSGDDIKTVQENLGHHTAAFTLDVYGHVTEQMRKDSAQRMERFIRGVSGL